MHNRYIQLLAQNKAVDKRRIEVVAAKEDGPTTIYLYDTIVGSEQEAQWFGGVSPAGFARALDGIDGGEVSLRINSPGGSVFGARAMAASLKATGAHVTAYIDGLAASAASLIAVTADRRVMADGAMMMIHDPWTVSLGNAGDLRADAELLDKVGDTLAQTYAQATGESVEQIKEWMSQTTWFDAAESVAAGFADELAGDVSAEAPVWNLAAFVTRHQAKQQDAAPSGDAKPNEASPADEGGAHRARQAQRLDFLNRCLAQ